ncbi:hypothetical protein GOICGAJE_03321 [Bacillus sp. MB95]|nr:hypothetical protein [Bacillus sp. MB95]
MQAIGRDAAKYILESDKDKNHAFLRELNLSYSLDKSIPYRGGKIEIHNCSSDMKEKFENDLIHLFLPIKINLSISTMNLEFIFIIV